jgi:hypothetical protein
VKNAIGLLVATLISGAAIGAVPDSSPYVPPVDPGILLVEGSGAVLGGAACAAGLGFLLARLYDPSADVWKTFGGTVLGGSLGYPIFCGVGCWASDKQPRRSPRRRESPLLGREALRNRPKAAVCAARRVPNHISN